MTQTQQTQTAQSQTEQDAPAPTHMRAPVPVQTRSGRFTSTEVSDFPAVTGREPMWKYTPVARIQELITGELDGSPYAYDVTAAKGFSSLWVGRGDSRVGSAGKPEDRASANAWTAFEQALLLSISADRGADGSEGDHREITLTRSTLGGAPRAAHTIVEVAPGAVATLILQNNGVRAPDARTSSSCSARMRTSRSCRSRSGTTTLCTWPPTSPSWRRARASSTSPSPSAALSSASTRRSTSAAHAPDAELLGAYFADATQHLEQQVYVFHDGPETRSRVTYKGALQGEGARAVWIGDVLIGRKAVGTDTYEQNRNLVLTDGARADSVPNLEIETGDIVGAGHASATGRFDDEQLFYLQSRGITEDEARRLVVRGFLSEIVQQIGSPALQERLQAKIEDELQATPVGAGR